MDRPFDISQAISVLVAPPGPIPIEVCSHVKGLVKVVARLVVQWADWDWLGIGIAAERLSIGF